MLLPSRRHRQQAVPKSHTLLPALDSISIVFTGSMLVWFGIMLEVRDIHRQDAGGSVTA